MKLYHFTADLPTHWEGIRSSGIIVPVAHLPPIRHPGIKSEWDEYLDNSVHLTTTPELRSFDIGTPIGNKAAIRIEVDVPDAIRWAHFLNKHRFPVHYRVALSRQFKDAPNWWVLERPCSREEWVEVIRMFDGEVLWTRNT